MPILPLSSQLLSPFADPKSVSKMPDLADIMGGGQAGVPWEDTYFRSSSDIYAQGTRIGYAQILSKLGIPGTASFSRVENMLKLPLTAMEVGKSLVEEIRNSKVGLSDSSASFIPLIENALGPTINGALAVTSAIPVAGWVINAMLSVARGIAKLVSWAKGLNKKVQEISTLERASFSYEADYIFAQECLHMQSTRDWTRLFLPPGRRDDEQTGQFSNRWFRFDKLKSPPSGGWRIMATSLRDGAPASASTWRLGLVPGSTAIHRAIEVESGANIVRDQGTLLVSTRSLAVQAWAMASSPSPAMFAVDADLLRNAWAEYLYYLRLEIMKMDWTVQAKTKLVNAYIDDFGWGPYDMPFVESKGMANFGIDDPKGEIGWKRTEKSTGIAVPVAESTVLRINQFSALDTTVCAYVDPKSAAIVSDSELRDQLVLRRSQLLKVQEVCSLDIQSIPDWSYRANVQAKIDECGLANSNKTIGVAQIGPNPPRAQILPSQTPSDDVTEKASDEAYARLKPQQPLTGARAAAYATTLALAGAAVLLYKRKTS